MSQAESRWDRDLPYGTQGEFMTDDLLDQLHRRVLSREDKRKRIHDARVYIETEQNPWNRGAWKDSGITKTEADIWVWRVDDTNILFLFPVVALRRAVAEARRLKVKPFECVEGGNPTRGFLLGVDQICRWGGQP